MQLHEISSRDLRERYTRKQDIATRCPEPGSFSFSSCPWNMCNHSSVCSLIHKMRHQDDSHIYFSTFSGRSACSLFCWYIYCLLYNTHFNVYPCSWDTWGQIASTHLTGSAVTSEVIYPSQWPSVGNIHLLFSHCLQQGKSLQTAFRILSLNSV